MALLLPGLVSALISGLVTGRAPDQAARPVFGWAPHETSGPVTGWALDLSAEQGARRGKGTRDLPRPAAGHWPGLRRPPTAPLHAAIARAITARAVRRLPLTLAFPDGSTWGAGGPRLELTDPDAFFARLGRDGLIGFGEAWMTGALTAGGWRPGSRPGSGETDVRVLNESTDELAAALTVLATRMAALVPRPLQRLRSGWQHRPPAAEANTPDGARENIHRHYDLSNEMFELFLDPSLTYSAALYPDPELAGLTAVPDPDAGLAEAQLAKIDSVLDLAGVRAGMQVIEIGSGWGALAIRAAQRGAEVTTLTLSIEQQDLARNVSPRPGSPTGSTSGWRTTGRMQRITAAATTPPSASR